MTPDSIRQAIASNPQSSEMRAYLVNQAVENDMADEIPDEWTINLYDPDSAYDDTQDLIADTYELPLDNYNGTNRTHADTEYDMLAPEDRESTGRSLIIAAHESGAVSFTFRPDLEPWIKFDIATADRLLEMITLTGYYLSNVPHVEQPNSTEPTTGITIGLGANGMSFVMTIPGREGNRQLLLDHVMVKELEKGLSAMANAADTYGRQDVPE